MNTKRWYFVHHVHVNDVSIFETDWNTDLPTDSYKTGGYDTEKEATEAALKNLNEHMDRNRASINMHSVNLIELTKANLKLLNKLKELI